MQAARKSNIVFILGDDLGYCDVSMYGCRKIPTPNIDSIAATGVKFTNGYVTAPVCSPSRAALVTGRYQHRYGFEFNAGPLQRALADPEMGLPASEITLAQMMKLPGKIKAGMVYEQPVSSLDLFPTAVALAGGNPPADSAYDGVDLLPYLTGKKKTAPHDVLCWRNGENAGVRKGNWKLFKGGDRYWLYDLSKDIGERRNVADKYPSIVTQLKQELAAWEARMKQPMWPCRKLGEQQFPVVVDGVKLNLCI